MRRFVRCQQDLYAYILTLVPNVADAQDIFQETAIAIWGKADEYRLDEPFMPWASRFAWFQVRKFRMYQARRGRHVVALSDEALSAPGGPADGFRGHRRRPRPNSAAVRQQTGRSRPLLAGTSLRPKGVDPPICPAMRRGSGPIVQAIGTHPPDAAGLHPPHNWQGGDRAAMTPDNRQTPDDRQSPDDRESMAELLAALCDRSLSAAECASSTSWSAPTARPAGCTSSTSICTRGWFGSFTPRPPASACRRILRRSSRTRFFPAACCFPTFSPRCCWRRGPWPPSWRSGSAAAIAWPPPGPFQNRFPLSVPCRRRLSAMSPVSRTVGGPIQKARRAGVARPRGANVRLGFRITGDHLRHRREDRHSRPGHL